MRTALPLFLAALLALSGFAAPDVLVPQIDGPWWTITGDPDLGQYTTEKQQPVDFGVWQAEDGTWQLWSCIRSTAYPGRTRLFYGWEGKSLTDTDWKPVGIKMTSRTELGEREGGMQAPHVVKFDGRYQMLYGSINAICRATSRDGKNFERVIQPGGKTDMFWEMPDHHGRDPMALFTRGKWHCYYTANLFGQGTDYVRTSDNLNDWSGPVVCAMGGESGVAGNSAECPFVVEKDPGEYYLFRTQRYGRANVSRVYYSTDPMKFGVNQDSRYLVARLPVAAPEIIHHQGQWYIAALLPSLKGIRMAKLKWGRPTPPPERGEDVLTLDDEAARKEWKIVSGNLESIFTRTTRSNFNPPQRWFVGTAERGGDRFDDDRTGVVESPRFTLTDATYLVYVGGGDGWDNRYVAIVTEDGEEIVRLSGRNDNEMRPEALDAGPWAGKQAFVRIVDNARGPWGHINFGGLFVAKPASE